MASVAEELEEINRELTELQHEMREVLGYTKSLWSSDKDRDHHHFPFTLYGFVMCFMSKIDYLSQHCFPQVEEQTVRMVEFMHTFLGYSKDSSELAVQFFRHKLMHTSTVVAIVDQNRLKYSWLLHYGDGIDLQRSEHMSLTGSQLFAGAFYYVEDLLCAYPQIKLKIENSLDPAVNWQMREEEMRSFKRRY